MMNSPVSVSEPTSFRAIGTRAELPRDDGRPYHVNLPGGDHLVLVFGQKLGAPAASFEHPALVARRQVVHWFKHSRPNGAKHWTSRAGVDLCFAIPTEKIVLIPEHGYSYVRAEVNGVRVTLNVSGATTGNGGWVDMVPAKAHCLLGHSIRDLRRIAAVAVPPHDLVGLWWKLTAEAYAPGEDTPRLFVSAKAEHDARMSLKHGARIVTGDDLSTHAAEVGIIEHFCNSPFRLTARLGGGIFRLKRTQVNWIGTARLNEVSVLAETEVRKIVITPPLPDSPAAAA